MKRIKRNNRIIRATNAIDPATSSICWGKRTKHYPGVAGKGGKTTNYAVPERKDGAVNA